MQREETAHPQVAHLTTGHFREGKGYETWRSHGTNDWLLIYTCDGMGRFGYVGGQILAKPGEATLLRPGALHDYGVEPTLLRWELLWAHFRPRPHWSVWLDWSEIAPGLMRIALEEPTLRKQVEASLRKADALAKSALRRREEFAMNALEEALLWCDTANPRSEQARLDSRVRAAMDYLCTHLAAPMTLDDLAEVCGLSVSRLAHLFREQVGMTPVQYLEAQRLERAAQLLEFTPRAVQAIAAEVGFENPFYFTLRFKRRTGLSPRDYRRKTLQRTE